MQFEVYKIDTKSYFIHPLIARSIGEHVLCELQQLSIQSFSHFTTKGHLKPPPQALKPSPSHSSFCHPSTLKKKRCRSHGIFHIKAFNLDSDRPKAKAIKSRSNEPTPYPANETSSTLLSHHPKPIQKLKAT